MRMKIHSLFILCCVLIQLPAYARLTATLDKPETSLNQPVQLTIISDQKQATRSIDISALEQDFNVVGRSSSTELSSHNGVTASKSVLILILLAKREGELTIPPLSAGTDQSEPLLLKVTGASSTALSSQQDETAPGVIIETLWEATENVYVQSQLNLIIRIYHQGNLLEAALDEPRAENTLIKRIGNDLPGISSKGGAQYQTIERRYALFPQKSGVLTIPPVALQVRVPDSQRKNSQQSIFNPFPRGRQITLSSKPLSIEVSPPATDFSGSTWLPADTVTLSRSGLPEGPINPGDAINMQIDFSALGLTGTQLPELQINGLSETIKVYPDQAVFNDNTTDGQTIEGHRVQTFVLIPSQSGTLEIPEIELVWWDRQNDRQQVASLPAVQIDVSSLRSNAAENSASKNVTTAQKTQTDLGNSGLPTNKIQKGGVNPTWKWLSLISLGFWLLSITWFMYYRRRHLGDKSGTSASLYVTSDLRPLIKQIRASASDNQAEQTWQALQAYSRARWPTHPPHSSEDWAKRLESLDSGQAVANLDSHLFNEYSNDAWDGEHFCKVLLPKLDTSITKHSKAGDQGIPNLYPPLQEL